MHVIAPFFSVEIESRDSTTQSFALYVNQRRMIVMSSPPKELYYLLLEAIVHFKELFIHKTIS